mmetsp:Transcript_8748/g.13135  ORF Transcript_8748/g.13135 Transcript_8748/m.13135 type:complete len:503 (-) Transcript_8748:54-1562(-)
MEMDESGSQYIKLDEATKADRLNKEHENSSKKLKFLFASTSAYVVLEFWMSNECNSLALLSDATHNLSDVASLFLALYTHQLEKRAYDSDVLPHGYKRAEVLGGMMNSISLITFCAYIIISALPSLVSPQKVDASYLYIWTALLGIFLNLMGMVAFREEGKRPEKRDAKCHTLSAVHKTKKNNAMEMQNRTTYNKNTIGLSDAASIKGLCAIHKRHDDDFDPKCMSCNSSTSGMSTETEKFNASEHDCRSSQCRDADSKEEHMPITFSSSNDSSSYANLDSIESHGHSHDRQHSHSHCQKHIRLPLADSCSHIIMPLKPLKKQPWYAHNHTHHLHDNSHEGCSHTHTCEGGSINLWAVLIHSAVDAFSSTVICITALAIKMLGNPNALDLTDYLDPLICILLSIFSIVSILPVCMESINILMESSPEEMEMGQVRESLLAIKCVEGIENLMITRINSRDPYIGIVKLLASKKVDYNCTVKSARRIMRQNGVGNITVEIEVLP